MPSLLRREASVGGRTGEGGVDPGDHAALEAWEVLESMPARSRRHVLASLAELMKQTPTRERKRG